MAWRTKSSGSRGAQRAIVCSRTDRNRAWRDSMREVRSRILVGDSADREVIGVFASIGQAALGGRRDWVASRSIWCTRPGSSRQLRASYLVELLQRDLARSRWVLASRSLGPSA